MKRWLIALIVITVLAGSVIAVALANNKKDDKVQPVQSVSVQEPEQKPVENVPAPTVTTPDVATEPVVAEPAPEPVEQPVRPKEELFGIIFSKVQQRTAHGKMIINRPMQMTNIILSKYDIKPELFIDSGLDATVNQCVEYYENLADDSLIMAAFNKGECGL